MSIYQNPTIIKIGDFFFKYRNKVFPLIIFIMFVLFSPTSSFINERIENIKDIIACVISISGLVIRGIVIGYAYIKRGGRNKKVYATELVTEGMFTICRNPLYFGNMLIYGGVVLMHGAWPVVVFGISIFYFIYICIIAAEERFLREKFGAEYDAYCAKTNRWIIDFTKFHEATKDMSFNFKKVIVKDYPTIFTTLLILAATERYEDIANNEIHSLGYQIGFIVFGLFCLVMMAAISVMKRKRIITAN